MNNHSSLLRKTHQYRLIFSSQFKLFSVILIFFLTLYSGAAQAVESTPREKVFVKQTASVSLSSQSIQYAIPEDEAPLRQVFEIQIISKKSVRLLITPTGVPSQQSSSATEKTFTQPVQSTDNPYYAALNAYRQKNGKPGLSWDGKLAQYAYERAELYHNQGGLDHHAGFNDFIRNLDGFKILGFYTLGENSGFGHSLGPASIIENSYGQSPSHNENQLSTNWSHVGIGVSGSATNFIFGGNKQ